MSYCIRFWDFQGEQFKSRYLLMLMKVVCNLMERIFFWKGERCLSTTKIWNSVHNTLWALTSEHRTESLFSLVSIRNGRKKDQDRSKKQRITENYIEFYPSTLRTFQTNIWILLKISPIKKFKFDLLFLVHLLQKSMKYYFSFQCFYLEPKSN